MLLARLSAIPRKTDNQTRPHAPQLPAATSISAALRASPHPKQNASCFVSPGSYFKPCFRAADRMNHQLFHSAFKPVHSGTQPPSSSHREGQEAAGRDVTVGPPPPLITNAKYLPARFVDSRGEPTDFLALHKKILDSSTPSLPIITVKTDFHFHLPSALALPPLCTPTAPHPLNTSKRKELRSAWKMASGASSSF